MINSQLHIKENVLENRVVFQPMEGFDCNEDGSAGKLTKRKYLRFSKCGAGIIWFEANAVCSEGRTNLRQMMLTNKNLDQFCRLVEDVKNSAIKNCGFTPKLILQLTHSGRYSYEPITMYKNQTYEKIGRGGAVASDEYLDSLAEHFANSTILAQKAGFDGVDVKACHGYLLSEALSAYSRKGKYGGSFENRIKLFLDCIGAAKSRLDSNKIFASRFGLSDMVAKPDGFATDENNQANLSETLQLLELMQKSGIELVNITIGNPYYNPHINRPFNKGSYIPPEPPSEGLKRFWQFSKLVKDANNRLFIVNSALTHYRKSIITASNEMLQSGICDLVGIGRGILAYPEFYMDNLAGRMDEKKLCVTCSKCTELMRSKQSSGCAVFDEVYKNIYKKWCQNG